MKKTMKKLVSILLVLTLITSVGISKMNATAATFNDINNPAIFYQGNVSGPCNLAALTMLLRRVYIAQGKDWSTVTQSSVQSSCCPSGSVGLYYSSKYNGISISHKSFSGGDNALKNLLAQHPEGIVLYNGGTGGVYHGVLVTDYTDGIFYCADYNYGSPSGRIPLSSVYGKKVTTSNATEYWYVSSPSIKLEPAFTGIPEPVNTLKCNKNVYNSSESIYFTWNPSNGAQEYWVYLWKDGTQLYSHNCGSNTSFTQAPSSPGKYTLIIRPGNSYGFNDSSNSCSFVVTDNVPDPVYNLHSNKNLYSTSESIVFNWDPAYGAETYWVYLWKDGVQLYAYECGNTTSFTQAPSSQGNYTLIIRPANMNGFNDSSPSYSFVVNNGYQIQYNSNGGTGAPSSQTKIYNIDLTLSYTVPTRNGYTFLGWSKNSNATSVDYYAGSIYSENKDATLYAVWQYNAPSTYTLSYNANGGTGAPSSQSGSTSYAISSAVPHRVGYTFLGWSTSSSGASSYYIPGNTITLSSNTTLYAYWMEARTVNTSSSNLANINFENQVRAYKFTPSSSGTYVFESTGSTDSKIYLYNSSGTEIANNDDSGNGNNFKLSYNLNAGSIYYIGVRLYSTGTGEVSFTVKKESSPQGSTNKCPYCNNIFTDESEYNKHLANCDGYFNNNNNIRVTIRNNPGTRTLNYGDTVRIYADAQNLPAGAKIGWFANNQDLIITSVAPDGTYCEITADGTGTITLEAKAVDANGNIITDSQGNWIGDSQKINVKTSLWLRIVSFFKNLFGMNRTTVQFIKEMF